MKTATSGKWLPANPPAGNGIESFDLIRHAVRDELFKIRIIFPDGAST
jgi:hypothetical protein